jgi:hypothetical protein
MHFSYLSVKRIIQFALLDFWCPFGAPARQCFGSVKPARRMDTNDPLFLADLEEVAEDFNRVNPVCVRLRW